MTNNGTAAGTASLSHTQEAAPTYASLAREAAAVRDEVRVVGEDADTLHEELQTRALDHRTTLVARRDAPGLLTELFDECGLSWTMIARLVGVSPAAVRKWRRGESVTSENRRRLARLVAFLEILRGEYPNIADPASWLEVRISDESILTPADLYVGNRFRLLFDLAAWRANPDQVLHEFDPDWRFKFGVDERFTVVDGPDGHPTIAERRRD